MKQVITGIKIVCSAFIMLIALSCKTETAKPALTDSISVRAVPPKQLMQDSIPQQTGFVNDYENLFTLSEKDSLERMIKRFEKETAIQIAVITLDSTMTTAATLDETTLQIARAWGVGQKNKKNGIAIGLSGFYKKIRIQNGYGIEGILSDAATKKIIDEDFIPSFKEGKYYEGLKRGLLSLMRKLREKYTA